MPLLEDVLLALALDLERNLLRRDASFRRPRGPTRRRWRTALRRAWLRTAGTSSSTWSLLQLGAVAAGPDPGARRARTTADMSACRFSRPTPALRVEPTRCLATWTNFAGRSELRTGGLRAARRPAGGRAAIGRAREAGRTVRVAGSGHSFTDAVLTDGTLLSLDRMDRVLDIDRETRARQGRGRDHARRAQRRPLGGGAGVRQPRRHRRPVAGRRGGDRHPRDRRPSSGTSRPGSHSIELTLADGSALEVGEASDADAWRAARVAIGSLGVMTAATLRAVPAFTLEAVEDDGADRGHARPARRARRRERPLRLLHVPAQRPGDDEGLQPDRHRAAPAAAAARMVRRRR